MADTEPFDPLEPRHCACLNLRRAARAITRHYDAALADAGLKTTQFTLLSVLKGRGPATAVELAEFTGTERSTLTRNLDVLERNGWVAPSPGEDRRERRLALTPDGRAVLRRAAPRWRRVQGQLTDALGAAEFARLLHKLEGIPTALG